MKSIDQILDAAADLIARGPMLAKGVFNYDADGKRCFCTVGAIDWTEMPFNVPGVETYEYLADYIGLPVHEYASAENAIYVWNDAEDRTQEQVVTTLRGAASQYRDEH